MARNSKEEIEFEMPNPDEESAPYIPTELTSEEKERFAKSDKDGLPFRFPQIWAVAARCLTNNEDFLCPDTLKEMHYMIQDWPIENTYDSDGAKYEDGTTIPDQNKPI